MNNVKEDLVGLLLWLVSSQLEHFAQFAEDGVVEGGVPVGRSNRGGGEQEGERVEGVLDFVKDMRRDAVKVIVCESIKCGEKACRKGGGVPFRGGEGVELRGGYVSTVNGV